jgi:hypothetical protein
MYQLNISIEAYDQDVLEMQHQYKGFTISDRLYTGISHICQCLYIQMLNKLVK